MSKASFPHRAGEQGSHPHVVATALECMANTIANLVTYNVRLTELLSGQTSSRTVSVGGFVGLSGEPTTARRTAPPVVDLAGADAPLDVDLGEVRASILGGPPGLLSRKRPERPEPPIAETL